MSPFSVSELVLARVTGSFWSWVRRSVMGRIGLGLELEMARVLWMAERSKGFLAVVTGRRTWVATLVADLVEGEDRGMAAL